MKKNSTTTEVIEMPTATNKYEVAAHLAINSLDNGEYHRLSADAQRSVLGFAVFGKKEFSIDPTGEGKVRLIKRVLPCDEIYSTYTFAEIAQAVSNRQVLTVS